MCILILTDDTLHLNYSIHFGILGLIPLLSVFISSDHLNETIDLVTLKNTVNFYSSCRIAVSEYTSAYFFRCFQSEITEKKTLTMSLIRACSCSLLFPAAAVILWLQIITSFLGLVSIALLSLQKLQISLTQHIRFIFSYFLKLSVCKYRCPLGRIKLFILNLVHP